MPAAMESLIKQRVTAHGESSDRIAADNGIRTGTVSNILDKWKRAVQGLDYKSASELAIHCKKEGINLADLTSALRIKNCIKKPGTEEKLVEQFIAKLHDPQKLVDILEKLRLIEFPLDQLGERILLGMEHIITQAEM